MLPMTTFACIKYWNGMNARYARGSLSLTVYRKSIADRKVLLIDMIQMHYLDTMKK